MEITYINLKVLLPYKVFNEVNDVKRLTAETNNGLLGVLPHRLDFVTSIEPGIFMYESDSNGVNYLALDEGVMVKTGREVWVSVRNAFGGADLGMLRESVEKEFMNISEKEKNVRSVMVKLESGFIQSMERFRK